VPSEGSPIRRRLSGAPRLPCAMPASLTARGRSAAVGARAGARAMDLMPDARGPAGLFLPSPRLPTSARHSASDVASSCAPRSPSSEPSPHSSRSHRSKLSDLASRAEASAERSSYPLPRSLPPDSYSKGTREHASSDSVREEKGSASSAALGAYPGSSSENGPWPPHPREGSPRWCRCRCRHSKGCGLGGSWHSGECGESGAGSQGCGDG